VKTLSTTIPGVVICEPAVFSDRRGSFLESWNLQTFADALQVHVQFVQDNRSRSVRGVLRGLHYQLDPMAQGKLVGVSRGQIYDVCVDLRRSSPSFGQSFGCLLDASKGTEIWIPGGLAHGFLVLSEEADVWYKTTQFYSPEHERCILWSDPQLAIEWPLAGQSPLISEKDSQGGCFADAIYFD
jgi:dTDP-4-dehydrorhamnose 3,5-epimerase